MYFVYVVKWWDGLNYWCYCYVLNCKWWKWSLYWWSVDEIVFIGISVLMWLFKVYWCVVMIYGSICIKCYGLNSVDGNNII